MSNSQRFFYQQVNQTIGEASYLPFLPITLINNNQTLLASGLLDTGATVNVLPYHFEENLGLNWDSQKISINLTGNLANYEAKAVLLKGQINNFPPVKLAFVWTKADNISIILGQVNFFLEFDICFYRSQLFFDINKN
jgi:hypothetical protein